MLNTVFPPKSAWSQINAASLTLKQIQGPHLEALIRNMKLKMHMGQINEKTRVVMDYIRLHMIIVTIYSYLEKRNLQSFEVS